MLLPLSSCYVPFVIAANVLLSASLVMLNKHLVLKYQFDFMSLLTALHFLASLMACIVMVLFGCIRFKPVKSYMCIFRIALGSLLSTVFMNYCLASSSIGFYQISKLACIPLTILLESLCGRRQQQLTCSLLFSLALVVVGMVMIVRQEVVYSQLGLLWATAGVLTTSAAQIFFAPLKRELDLDSLQLLFHTAPWLAFGSFLAVPLFGPLQDVLEYSLDADVMLAVGLTCLVAVAFNVSNYSVLSSVSPLSYTVLGHVKTLLIVLAGSYLFQTWPDATMALGMAAAVLGVGLYTSECEAQAAQRGGGSKMEALVNSARGSKIEGKSEV
ncbi:hypothetical protein EON64_10555 [archaeon]|nr:MAG: hypothetical protein EON64_10555 [archaeon]